MTVFEYEKMVNWIKIFCIIVGVFTIVTNLIGGIFSAIIHVALLYVFYILTKKKNIAGPIIGIVLGVLYFASFKFLEIVIGVLLIAVCAAMYKFILDISKTRKM